MRPVFVGEHVDAALRAQREVSEHVTGGQGGEQKVFRVVFGGIPAENSIGGAEQHRLARYIDDVISTVPSVRRCAGAEVARSKTPRIHVSILFSLSGSLAERIYARDISASDEMTAAIFLLCD